MPDSHPADARWEGELTQTVQSLLREAPELAGSTIDSVQCSSDACRIAVSHSAASQQEALPEAVVRKLQRGHDLWGRNQNTGDELRSTFYVRRHETTIVDEPGAVPRAFRMMRAPADL